MCLLLDDDASMKIDEMMPHFIKLLGSAKMSRYGRDNIMELLTKFITRRDGVGWSKKFIEVQGNLQFLSRTLNMHHTVMSDK